MVILLHMWVLPSMSTTLMFVIPYLLNWTINNDFKYS